MNELELRRAIAMKQRHLQRLHDELEGLRLEVEELETAVRKSRRAHPGELIDIREYMIAKGRR